MNNEFLIGTQLGVQGEISYNYDIDIKYYIFDIHKSKRNPVNEIMIENPDPLPENIYEYLNGYSQLNELMSEDLEADLGFIIDVNEDNDDNIININVNNDFINYLINDEGELNIRYLTGIQGEWNYWDEEKEKIWQQAGETEIYDKTIINNNETIIIKIEDKLIEDVQINSDIFIVKEKNVIDNLNENRKENWPSLKNYLIMKKSEIQSNEFEKKRNITEVNSYYNDIKLNGSDAILGEIINEINEFIKPENTKQRFIVCFPYYNGKVYNRKNTIYYINRIHKILSKRVLFNNYQYDIKNNNIIINGIY